MQLQQTVALTTRNVKNAYWDLVYAIDNMAVQRQSLELAQQSLKDNRARVEIGTMAPIDIIQAEAEVAQREESVILAEASIGRAEDRLRALIYDPSSPDFWTVRLQPSDRAAFAPLAVDTDAAVKRAIGQRTDLAQTRKTDRIERHQHPVLPQPDDAGHQRGGGLFREWPGRPAIRSPRRAISLIPGAIDPNSITQHVVLVGHRRFVQGPVSDLDARRAIRAIPSAGPTPKPTWRDRACKTRRPASS